ncbi:MAG: glycosyltransferase [Actinobacteria bacterium]|nr:glycosyltransferase [Actinomycetota bacterium]
MDNFASALSAIGVSVEVFSAYSGHGRPAWPVKTVITHEKLHRHAVLRGLPRRYSILNILRAFSLFVFKRLDRIRIRILTVRALNHESENAVIVFTDVVAKRALDDLGVSSRIHGIQIGQHHSSFQNLEIDAPVRAAVEHAFQSIGAFTALSQEDARKFASLLVVPCFAVPNMLSPQISTDITDPSTDNTTMVALGRLSSEKQFEMLILAFLRATDRDDLRDWTLDIYGDGDQRSYLQALIEDRHVQDRVRLRGVTDDVARVFSGASLHVVSSRYEGFGLSVLEAAQHGVATVAFDCSPGLHDLMVSVHGVLVQPTEGVDGLAAGIQCLIEDPASLRERGLRAREGTSVYEPERILRQWAPVVEAAARSKSGSTPRTDQVFEGR